VNAASEMRCRFFARELATNGGPVQRRPRRLSLAPLLVLVFFVGAPRVWAQGNSPSEYQIKAAFLLNFAKFVDWPPNSFAGPESPFLICVVGEDPFGGVLDEYLMGKKLASTPCKWGAFRT